VTRLLSRLLDALPYRDSGAPPLRRAVLKLLNDEEWGKWSDGTIAKKTATSQAFVSQMRKTLTSKIGSEPPAPRTYTTKHGTVSKMNTAPIGKSRAGEPDEDTGAVDAPACGLRPCRAVAWQLQHGRR